MTFQDLPLAATIQSALAEQGLVNPTPIQTDAIPPALAGRDILASAQTGSGKTAAFVLPMLEKLQASNRRPGRGAMQALVLVPTRELALQVCDVFRKCGKNLNLSIQMIYGGVGQKPQIDALSRGTDVVVATPGRLLDLHQQGQVRMDEVSMLVLDEVDRMLDMGFIRDVRKIIGMTPRNRQTLCFSATITRELEPVVATFLHDPVRVLLQSGSGTAEQVDHRLCHTFHAQKFELLTHLISSCSTDAPPRTLVFTATKHGANRLVQRLEKSNFQADAMHGNKSQNARERALERFRNSPGGILVATDVAARGIDVKDVDLVINFDLPKEGDSYVHRVGRTARAGKKGKAYSLVSENDAPLVKGIERFLRQTIPVHEEHPYPRKAGDRPPATTGREDSRQEQGRRPQQRTSGYRSGSSESAGNRNQPQRRTGSAGRNATHFGASSEQNRAGSRARANTAAPLRTGQERSRESRVDALRAEPMLANSPANGAVKHPVKRLFSRLRNAWVQ
jgi:ATP-dependent RNA helicase RhlE